MQTRPDRILMVLPPARIVRKAVEAGHRGCSVRDPALRAETERDDLIRHSEEVMTASDERALRALVVRAARVASTWSWRSSRPSGSAAACRTPPRWALRFFRLPPCRPVAPAHVRALAYVHAVHLPGGATRHGCLVVDGTDADETLERLAAARRLLHVEPDPIH